MAQKTQEKQEVVAVKPFVADNAWQLGNDAVWYVPLANYCGPYARIDDGVLIITTACGDIRIQEVAYPDGVKPIGHTAGFTISAPPKLMSAVSITYGIRGPLVSSADIHRLIQLNETDGIVTFTNCYDGKWMPKVCADVLSWMAVAGDDCVRERDTVATQPARRPGRRERGLTLGQLLGNERANTDVTVYDLARALEAPKTLEELDKFMAREDLHHTSIIRVLAMTVTGTIERSRKIDDISQRVLDY